ncbi:uncharacterized protein ACA1_275680 [Acanthamoeba castellanii str. Neff]|uniref:DUF4291 domain containing protein n=1 Tax=Acanthamoeba castellanii (strain ATCC 30010 / Neff) TaxID=1257118 RepID=L8GQC9_ACACF|nr:uncharacterized protein ACA1_275680 [Acanthamoeba castellanii str. Neff]ELR15394.1 hypothetical protein ACA1_275680 [Acanthamoeba castellanii str. Neff]
MEESNTTTEDTTRSKPKLRHRLETEAYPDQKKRWPRFGKFILAQYTPEAILVYQAFKPEIGRYAVANQRFTGCEAYSPTRMTWIKTNFLWMMFRSGWGGKKNQEMTLGIWLKREAFDRYISIACKKGGHQRDGSVVRLQWDPDHHPSGAPLKNRRAIQLGLKNVITFSNGEDILRIDDLTEFVAGCRPEDTSSLVTPKETIYEPDDPAIVANLGLSHEDEVRSEAGREVAAAMQEGRGLWISYKGGSHERKPRLVKPLRWQPHTAKSLFVGLCGYTDGEKEFYVHNILEMRHEPWTLAEEPAQGDEEEKSRKKSRQAAPVLAATEEEEENEREAPDL